MRCSLQSAGDAMSFHATCAPGNSSLVAGVLCQGARMGSLMVITGPPGAGKSTVAELIADRLASSVLVEGDAFFAFLRAGAIEPWRFESHARNERHRCRCWRDHIARARAVPAPFPTR